MVAADSGDIPTIQYVIDAGCTNFTSRDYVRYIILYDVILYYI